MSALYPKADIYCGNRNVRFRPIAAIALGAVVLVPGQLIERRLIGTGAVTIFRQVEFLVFVVFDAGTVLSTPTVPRSIEATCCFHAYSIYRAARLRAIACRKDI